MVDSATGWPAFPTTGWSETRPTLHLWTQIVGKVRTALSPSINHYWHSTLYVSPRGLTTTAIPYRNELFEIGFDFVDHQLTIVTSWGDGRVLPLRAQSVAAFYRDFMRALADLAIDVRIWTKPVEMPERIPFEFDEHHTAYDPSAAHTFLQALVQTQRVFTRFRGEFLGKCSPVHFFWGAFDLAVTRFSGRRAPTYTGAAPFVHPHVMHESYSHEVSSAGFWPADQPVFYSYAVPQPAGFPSASVQPAGAVYDRNMGEFLLQYDAIRTSSRPDEDLLTFLHSTYDAAADLGDWDRELLEQRPECACTPVQRAALQGEHDAVR